MFDFCFTLPFGVILVAHAALTGPFSEQGWVQLILGAVISWIGYASLRAYNEDNRKISALWPLLSFSVTTIFLVTQWDHFGTFIMYLNIFMAIFYVWNVVFYIPRYNSRVKVH
jgi:hypothetical protein